MLCSESSWRGVSDVRLVRAVHPAQSCPLASGRWLNWPRREYLHHRKGQVLSLRDLPLLKSLLINIHQPPLVMSFSIQRNFPISLVTLAANQVCCCFRLPAPLTPHSTMSHKSPGNLSSRACLPPKAPQRPMKALIPPLA